jgi:hypothetical protein
MPKNGFLRDALIFIIVVVFLIIVIPLISSILKQLFVLQFVIAIAGAIFLRMLIQRIKKKQ